MTTNFNIRIMNSRLPKNNNLTKFSAIFLFVLLCLIVSFVLAGCSSNTTVNSSQEQLTYTVCDDVTQEAITDIASSDSGKAKFEIVSNAVNAVSVIQSATENQTVNILEMGAIPHSEFEINPDTYKKSDIDAATETELAKTNTKAIYAAICQVSKSGGGTVVVPNVAGQVFYTSAIWLEDNVNLYFEDGATLKFTTNYSLYEGELMLEVYGDKVDDQGLTKTRFESVELMNYSPFIYAYGKKNIAITGKGILDGQASIGDGEHPETMTWHQWKKKRTYQNGVTIEAQDASRANLYKMGQINTPVEERKFGSAGGDETSGANDGFLRPNFIQPYNCQNVLISDVKIKNSPMWEINPVLCDSVVVQNTTVESHLHNNDGCDPECSSNVFIRNNTFDVGDDCIAIKSGRNGDGLRINRPSYNIVIEGNTFKDGHGGITIGSEITSGVCNVFSNKNNMNSDELEAAYRFKTNYIRGGKISNIYYGNDTVKKVKADKPIVTVNLNYDISSEVEWMERMGVEYSAYIPSFAEVYIDNMIVNEEKVDGCGGKTAFELKGFSRDSIAESCKVDSNIGDCYISGFHVKDSSFNCCQNAFTCEYVKDMILDGVSFYKTQNKDKFTQCSDFTFNRCKFVQCYTTEDELNKIENCIIENCQFNLGGN